MIDTVVVGAGHAGLAASFCLKERGLDHIVYERGSIGETWRSQRWDSFMLNTPNTFSHLVGDEYAGNEPEGFYSTAQFLTVLERYRERFDLPVETEVNVDLVRPAGDCFEVGIRRSSGRTERVEAASVIVASGMQNVPKIPAAAADLPPPITSMHAAEYRSADRLPGGGVLVVGSGQSGLQIAEDLLEAGRRVVFSSSKVGRVPRRYRGKDILDWMRATGMLEIRTSDLEDPSIRFETIPHVSGVGPQGRTVSHQQLARDGARIVGRLTGFENGSFHFAGDAAENVRYADAKCAEVKRGIDNFLIATGAALPPLEDDPRDEPDPDARCTSDVRYLDAAKSDIRTVIWCTGFRGSFDWIDAPIIGDRGLPIHDDGVARIPGLYFLGFPWLRRRKSGIINGLGDDARYVVSHLASSLKHRRSAAEEEKSTWKR